MTVSAASMRRGDDVGRLDAGVVGEVEHADDHRLAGDRLEQPRVEPRLRRLDREHVRRAVRELGQERVAGRPVVDDVGVAEAGVQRGRAPVAPSSARSMAGSANARAFSARDCSHGSSICTTSAPAANRSRTSSLTATAKSSASSASSS